jgi:hypothetical protein
MILELKRSLCSERQLHSEEIKAANPIVTPDRIMRKRKRIRRKA